MAKMTAKQKKARAAARKYLRARGILPPAKKRLNRKKFCEDAEQILKDECGYEMTLYIHWALLEMLHHTQFPECTRTLEAVGAAKVIHLALKRKQMEEECTKAGKTSLTTGELYEAVEDIYRA